MATGRLPDPNSSPLTAKGDLYTYSTVPAKLAVGNNGETLVADSSATTGLRWQGNFAAGKNKVINGDFGIWQRGTSFTTQNNVYTADRIYGQNNGTATYSITRQAFTPGAAPVAGYESQFFYRYQITAAGSGNTFNNFGNRIEDVRTLAGQTVTASLWLKADTNRNVTFYMYQNFGSGGSSTAVAGSATFAVTTSWTRFTHTFTMTSVSGKTIGTGSYLDFNLDLPANTTMTIDAWGLQLEAGNTATAFQTATGTLAGELAAAQRYCVAYGKNQGDTALANALSGIGVTTSTTEYQVAYYLPVKMRAIPTLTYSGTSNHRGSAGLIANTGAALGIGASSQIVNVGFTVASGLTANQWAMARQDSSGTGSVLFEAEL